jgi:hypothetical protein
MTGVSVVLASGDTLTDVAATSGPSAARIAEFEFALGEGPAFDAYLNQTAVHEPHLDTQGMARWPAFARDACGAGICAIFAFPLQIGTVRLGALELSRREPGALADPMIMDANVLAELATNMTLYLQAGAADGELPRLVAEAGHDRIQVHQATGMIAAMLAVSVADALAVLRAHALSADKSLYDAASDVVARKLRFDS